MPNLKRSLITKVVRLSCFIAFPKPATSQCFCTNHEIIGLFVTEIAQGIVKSCAYLRARKESHRIWQYFIRNTPIWFFIKTSILFGSHFRRIGTLKIWNMRREWIFKSSAACAYLDLSSSYKDLIQYNRISVLSINISLF